MNPYKVLGLEENASLADVKKAYRKLAMKHHPDKGGNHNEFIKIQAAYDHLVHGKAYRYRSFHKAKSDEDKRDTRQNTSNSSQNRSTSSTPKEEKNDPLWPFLKKYWPILALIAIAFLFVASNQEKSHSSTTVTTYSSSKYNSNSNSQITFNWPKVNNANSVTTNSNITSASNYNIGELPKMTLSTNLSTNTAKNTDTIFIYGTTPDYCAEVIVDTYLNGSSIGSPYALTKYERGDTSFTYQARQDLGNLKPGLMKYTFTANCYTDIVTNSVQISISAAQVVANEEIQNTNPQNTEDNSPDYALPENATLNFTGNDWTCIKGYRRNYTTNSCEKVIIPANGELNFTGNDWTCIRGYSKNYSSNTCDKVIIPQHGELNFTGNDWTCSRGYKKNIATNSCDPVYSPN